MPWMALLDAPAAHGGQLVFGVDEFYKLKRMPGAYYTLFPEPDYGTVVLVTIVGSLVNPLAFAFLCGNGADVSRFAYSASSA
jgi:hypothetical protein